MLRVLIVAALFSLTAAGCLQSDVGSCCQVAAGVDPAMIIPEPAMDSAGAPANSLSLDPQLLCNEVACVSYLGSNPYCTATCQSDKGCPGDFKCVAVVASDPTVAKYCVKENHACE